MKNIIKRSSLVVADMQSILILPLLAGICLFISLDAGVTEGYALVLPAKEASNEKLIYNGRLILLFGDHHDAGTVAPSGERRPALVQLDEFVDVLKKTSPLRTPSSPLLVLLEKPGLRYDQDSVLGLLDTKAQGLAHISVKNAEVRRMAIAAEVILNIGKKYLGDDWPCFIGDRPYGQITLQHVIQELENHYAAYVEFSKVAEPNEYLAQNIKGLREKIDYLYEDLLQCIINLDVKIIGQIKETIELHQRKLEALYRNKKERASYLKDLLPYLSAYVTEFGFYLQNNRALLLKHAVGQELIYALEAQRSDVAQRLKDLFQSTEEGFSNCLDYLCPSLQNLYDVSGMLVKDLLKSLDVTIRELAEKDAARNLITVLMSPADTCLELSLYQTVLESEADVCIVAGADHIRTVRALLDRAGAKTLTQKVPYRTYPRQADKIRLLARNEIMSIFEEHPLFERVMKRAAKVKTVEEGNVLKKGVVNYCNQKVRAEGSSLKKIALLTITSFLCMIISAKEGKNHGKETLYETVTVALTAESSRRD